MMRTLLVVTASCIVCVLAASSGHPAFAQQASVVLFRANPAVATPSTPPDQAKIFDSLALPIDFPAGSVAKLSKNPDGTGAIVIDNFMKINGVNVCEGLGGPAFPESCIGGIQAGFHDILRDNPKDVEGMPIDTVLIGINPLM